MSRIEQDVAERGSQHWLQEMVGRAPQLFADALIPELEMPTDVTINWRSPLKSDGFAEYRDAAFLARLGLTLTQRSLPSFWPRRGPVWDGLATSSRGDVLLVEAKANVPELNSPGTQAGPASARLIESSLTEAKGAFGAPLDATWSSTYYQYANRLAHLYLLRALNQIPAYMVFLYFTNAHEVSGPRSRDEWEVETRRAHEALQLHVGPLSPFVISVFVNAESVAAIEE